jgi:hypothetical protein
MAKAQVAFRPGQLKMIKGIKIFGWFVPFTFIRYARIWKIWQPNNIKINVSWSYHEVWAIAHCCTGIFLNTAHWGCQVSNWSTYKKKVTWSKLRCSRRLGSYCFTLLHIFHYPSQIDVHFHILKYTTSTVYETRLFVSPLLGQDVFRYFPIHDLSFDF